MIRMNTRFAFRFTKDDREKGSLLVIAVLILAVVTVIGIMSSKTAVVETQMATYDKQYRRNWSLTDGTTDMLMPKAIEKGLERRSPIDLPFGESQGVDLITLDTADDTGYLLRQPSGDCLADHVDETEFDSAANQVNADGEIVSNNSARLEKSSEGRLDGTVLLKVYSTTKLQPGSALQIAEGYHGLGKGLAGGGAVMEFKIRGVGRGATAAGGKVRQTTAWMHVIR